MSQFERPNPTVNFPNGIQHKEHPVTDLDLTKAIEAADDAYGKAFVIHGTAGQVRTQAMEAGLRAALPHIRAIIAEEIRAEKLTGAYRLAGQTHTAALEYAAKIAQGAPRD